MSCVFGWVEYSRNGNNPLLLSLSGYNAHFYHTFRYSPHFKYDQFTSENIISILSNVENFKDYSKELESII
jgi:hypothetical protein